MSKRRKKLEASFDMVSVTCDRQQLTHALAYVCDIGINRSTIPVFSHVRLDAADKVLRLTATNLDLWAFMSVPCSEGTGSLCAPAKMLSKILERAEGNEVHIGFGDSGLVLEVGAELFVEMNGMPADEMSGCPRFEENWFEVPAEAIAAIGRVRFAVSTEESRPILNGVFLQSKEVVSTNGHMLKIVGCETDIPRDLILPIKTANVLAKHFPEGASLLLGDAYVEFRRGQRSLISRLIEGPYPNYHTVIPKSFNCTAVVNRVALLNVIARMDAIASEQTHRTALRLYEGRDLEVLTWFSDMSGRAREFLPASITGEVPIILFNARYLLNLLNSITSETVELRLVRDDLAAIIVGTDEPAANTALIMPLRNLDGEPEGWPARLRQAVPA